MTRERNFLLGPEVTQFPGMTDLVDVPLYRIWPGTNRSLFRGLFSCGPWKDCGYNFCLWCTLLGPTIFFCVIPAKTVWLDVSPAITLVTSGLGLACFGLFIVTTFSDPGYIPRKEVQVALGIQDEVRKILGVPVANLISEEKAYLSDDGKLVVENEFDDRILLTAELSTQGYKYCETCRIIRPPRASHCSDCQSCCLRHDHHCPFVTNCIGHRNYVYFTAFVVSAVALGLMILLSIIMWMAHGSDFFSPLTVKIISFVVGIPVGLLLLVGTGFLFYHTFLVCRGQTTRENIRGRRVRAIQSDLADPSILSTSFFSRPPRLYPPLRTVIRVSRRPQLDVVI